MVTHTVLSCGIACQYEIERNAKKERELLLRCRMTANTNWLPEKVAKYGEETKGSYQTRSLDSLV